MTVLRWIALVGLVGLALAMLAASADAQDSWDIEGRYVRRHRPVKPALPEDRAPLGLQVFGRVYGWAPGGDAADPGPGEPSIDYADLFGAGTGGGVAAHMAWWVRETGQGRAELSLGPRLSFDAWRLSGDTYVDTLGDAWSPDTWSGASLLSGFQFRLRIGRHTSPVRFVLGAHVVAGAAFLGGVDTDWTPVAGPPARVALYDATTTGAFEIAFQIGISGQPSRYVDLQLVAFLALGVTGAPADPDPGPAAAQPGAGTMLQGLFGVSLGVTLRFPRS